jgi:hypothetical protein
MANIAVVICKVVSTGMFVKNLENLYHPVVFEVLTAIVMKSYCLKGYNAI